jgi:hypothetical protein
MKVGDYYKSSSSYVVDQIVRIIYIGKDDNFVGYFVLSGHPICRNQGMFTANFEYCYFPISEEDVFLELI